MSLGAFSDSQPASSSHGGPRLTSSKPKVDFFKAMASQLKDNSKRPPPGAFISCDVAAALRPLL